MSRVDYDTIRYRCVALCVMVVVRYVDLGLSQVDLGLRYDTIRHVTLCVMVVVRYVDLVLSQVDLGLRYDTIRHVTLHVMV